MSHSPSPSRVPLPAGVYALGLGIFLLGTSEFVVAGLIPYVAAAFDVSAGRAGWLVSAFALGMAVGAPVMAMATNRFEQRTILLTALGVFAVAHLLSAFAPTFAALLTARVVAAVATGAYWSVAVVVAARLAPAGAQARAVGVMVTGLTLATVLGVPLGTWLSGVASWQAPFVLLAALSLGAVVALTRSVPAGRSHAAVAPAEALRALKSRRIWATLAVAGLAQGGVFAVYTFILPVLDVGGTPGALIPLVLAAFGVASSIGSWMGGRIGDLWPRRLVAAATVGTALLLTVMTAAISTASLAVPAFVLVGFTGFLVPAVVTARVVSLAAAAPVLASAMAVAAFNVGNALGPWAAGVALDSGQETGPGVVGAIFVGAATVIWIVSTRDLPPGGATDTTPAQSEPAGAGVGTDRDGDRP